MKTNCLTRFSIILVFLFTFVAVPSASAHGDEPRVEIAPELLNPGGVLDIRGVDFEFEEEVSLLLVGQQAEIPLGTVLADVEGVFLLTVTLPVDLTAGTYVIRATTDDHQIESPAITVWGSANQGGEDDSRQEDDGLLAPFPTIAAGEPTPLMASTTSPKLTSLGESAVEKEESSSLFWIVGGIGVILIFGILLKRKR